MKHQQTCQIPMTLVFKLQLTSVVGRVRIWGKNMVKNRELSQSVSNHSQWQTISENKQRVTVISLSHTVLASSNMERLPESRVVFLHLSWKYYATDLCDHFLNPGTFLASKSNSISPSCLLPFSVKTLSGYLESFREKVETHPSPAHLLTKASSLPPLVVLWRQASTSSWR